MLPAASKNAAVQSVRPDPYFKSRVEELLLGQRRPHEITRAGYSIKFERPLDNLPRHKEQRAAVDTVRIVDFLFLGNSLCLSCFTSI
jgi:hypothetical protein